jgi:membrane associated rhomboid family serine protease
VQIHVPDPAWTGSPRLRASFRAAVQISLAFVALLWLVLAFDWSLDLDLARFGIRPRDVVGLAGIVAGPLVHGDVWHLLANTVPLLVLGTTMLHLYPSASPRVLVAAYLGPGIAVWLFGRDAIHIGASGIAYTLFAYILIAGLLRRDRRAIAAALLVSFMYGTLVWGVLPIDPRASWEAHLAGALIGAVCAVAFRNWDIPPRRRYSWEYDPAAATTSDVDTMPAMPPAPSPTAPPTLH